MQITETRAEGLQREYRVVVPHDTIEARMADRLLEIGRTVNLPGFRPGKAPVALLRKRYGESLRSEILQQTIQDGWQKTVKEKGFRPALEPKIEIVTFQAGSDFEYKMAFELIPEIPSVEFSAISLDRLVAELDNTEIDRALERLAERNRQFDTVSDRVAQDSDVVVIDFTGTIDGQPFQGGNATDFPLSIGSGGFLPGFEDGLRGATAGTTRSVTVKMPDNHPNEALRAKDALFTVSVKEVRIPRPISIDDEFAKTLGLSELSALRKAIKEQLEREYAQYTRGRIKRQLLDKLAETHSFALPAGMVDREFETIWQRLDEARKQDNLDTDDKGLSEDALRARYRTIAERRVRLGLLISEIGRTNNITVTQEEINRAIAEQARRFPGQEARVFDFYQKNPQAAQELQAPLFEDKVVDFVVEMAKVTTKTVSIENLLKNPDTDEKSTNP